MAHPAGPGSSPTSTTSPPLPDPRHGRRIEQAPAAALSPATVIGKFVDGVRVLVPKYPVVDEMRGVLYVSDSRGNNNIGPGVYRFDLKTGQGRIWCTDPMDFANGMTLAPDGNGLYVVESDRAQVSYVPINSDGSAGTTTLAIADVQNVRTVWP